ncbi:fungal-specific transcription factor domain-containing protein [Mycena belliarum]|uniref:Fungal-specific transcription factor domain-containing protein n=1 Tax=Mycena belliarum TaxID=1033014 RepID=A0AAD6TZ33_9AGAR|nr:fungal-specific transcription factor domain-containing protein [Mycena belliae]
MSDEFHDDALNAGLVKPKKRRLQRSCDYCRKRKIRCDSANMPNGRCSGCVSFNAPCMHSEPPRKRGPKNKNVEELKQQLSALEAKLRYVQPEGPSSTAAIIQYSTPSSDSTPSPAPFPEEDLSHDELCERFRAFSLGGMQRRFFGASSGFMLVKNVINIKEEYVGRPLVTHPRRPEYWTIRPWEARPNDQPPRYVFPAQDLIHSLIKLYFTNVHPTLPLLHRPSFERSVAESLHSTNHQFAATLLAVLAVASRYSDDPRVFVAGSNATLSSGWIFFEQVQVVRKSLFDEPSLYEVQLYCLITLFSLGTSSPQASWLYIGLGIRFIQERGEHRRKRDGHKLTAEDELWKRAFWCLLSFDRTMCSFLGRPSAIHVEDYDVVLPLEVDDEYWEHSDPEQAFKQPPGKPSRLTYFVWHIKLLEILGSTLRRLYASNKSRALMGLVGNGWEERAVAELDSAMNEFLGSLPEHLRWDSERTGVFFDQSAALHTLYYWLQITIHRPYIHKLTPLAFPSLAICTSAARSAIHVMDVWQNKLQRVAPPYMQITTFISGVILILNLFGVKRAGLPIDVGKELAHVTTSLRILKSFETRWQTAGRLWELLSELQSWDGPPLQRAAPKESVPEAAPAGMCTTKRKALEEAQAAGKSLFTKAAEVPLEKSATISTLSTVSEELSVNALSDMMPLHNLSQNKNGMTATQQAEVSIEELLAATAGYDHATGLTKAAGYWSDTGFANMMVDNDLMSVWELAPTGFGNLADWDAFIENKNGAGGFNWPVNFDSKLASAAFP